MLTSPVFDVQRFSVHDGPGIRTTVFLRGCPLRCAWCHNPEGLERVAEPADDPWLDEVMREVRADRDFFEVSGGGVTLSGGEPLLSASRALALLRAVRAEGLHTCLQTCGAVPSATLRAVLPWVDLFMFDLKHADDGEHRRWTGAGNALIHQNARLLVEHGAKVQFRMPVLPGINDDVVHLERMAALLRDLRVEPLELVPYQRHYLSKLEARGQAPLLPELVPPSRARLAELELALRRLRGRQAGAASVLSGA